MAIFATLTARVAGAEEAPADPVLAHPSKFIARNGGDLYRAICQGCHMADAKGARGAAAYPALASNPNLQSPLYPAVIVVNGLRAMPAFADVLDDEQIAAVVNYVRTNFGNRYTDTVSAAEVEAVRPATAGEQPR